jgi:hypothetical protein
MMLLESLAGCRSHSQCLHGLVGCLASRMQVLQGVQEALAAFFRSRGVELQDWVQDDYEISSLVAGGTAMLEPHSCGSGVDGEVGDGPKARRQTAGHNAPATGMQGASPGREQQQNADVGRAPRVRRGGAAGSGAPAGRWQQLQQLATQHVVKPLQQVCVCGLYNTKLGPLNHRVITPFTISLLPWQCCGSGT